MQALRERLGARPVGTVLIVESLLLFVPVAILGAAIDWPASLSRPAGVVLPLIATRAGAVTAGYFSYLVYSILFFPMAYLLSAYVEGGRIESAAGRIAVGFAALSTLARSIGIVRWLTAMPILAGRWVESPGRDIEIAYETLNSFAGGLGESVGVGLFAGMWAAVAAVTILRRRTLPTWIGWFGVVSAVAVAVPIIEFFGVELGGLISVTTSVVHVWWLCTGVTLIVIRDPSEAAKATA